MQCLEGSVEGTTVVAIGVEKITLQGVRLSPPYPKKTMVYESSLDIIHSLQINSFYC